MLPKHPIYYKPINPFSLLCGGLIIFLLSLFYACSSPDSGENSGQDTGIWDLSHDSDNLLDVMPEILPSDQGNDDLDVSDSANVDVSPGDAQEDTDDVMDSGDGEWSDLTDSGDVYVNIDLDNWKIVNPLPQTNDLYAITYGSQIYIAVGANGTALISQNGFGWTATSENPSVNLNSITYHNGTFVAVGNDGDNDTVWSSANGLAWSKKTIFQNTTLYGVTPGGPVFSAVGISLDGLSHGKFLTSPNGWQWNAEFNDAPDPIYTVTYGYWAYVAAGFKGLQLISTNGKNWIITAYSGSEKPHLWGTACGNGIYVVVGQSGTILTSANGTGWTSRNSGVLTDLKAVSFGNGIFIIVGSEGKILTSSNGATWRSRTSGVTDVLQGVIFGNQGFIAVGSAGLLIVAPPL